MENKNGFLFGFCVFSSDPAKADFDDFKRILDYFSSRLSKRGKNKFIDFFNISSSSMITKKIISSRFDLTRVKRKYAESHRIGKRA